MNPEPANNPLDICRVHTRPRPDAELDPVASEHAGGPVYRPEHCHPAPWAVNPDSLYLPRFDVTLPFVTDADADLIIYAANLPSTIAVVSYPTHVWVDTGTACEIHVPVVFARHIRGYGVFFNYEVPDGDTEAQEHDEVVTQYAISRGWAHRAVSVNEAQAATGAVAGVGPLGRMVHHP